MTDDRKRIHAENIFEKLWKAYDRRDIEILKDFDLLKLDSYQITRGGHELKLTIEIDADNMLIRLSSELDIDVPQSRRTDMAVCICKANCELNEGVFEYDILEGRIIFRMARFYEACELTDSYLTEMHFRAGMVIDEFYGEFERLSSGEVSRDALLGELDMKKHHKWKASEEYEETADAVFDMLAVALKEKGFVMRAFRKMRMFYIDIPNGERSIGVMVRLDADEQIINIAVPFEVEVRRETAPDVAALACAVTEQLVSGGISFDFLKGTIYYNTSTSFLDGGISSKAFLGIVGMSSEIFRCYNNKFKKISSGETE